MNHDNELVMLPSIKMNSSSITLPTNIDEVIAHLDAIVSTCEATGCRMGYFPAMYNRVTRQVKHASSRVHLKIMSVWNGSMLFLLTVTWLRTTHTPSINHALNHGK